jgi:RNA-directed DNA polymerase
MTKAPGTLQDLQRKIYTKAKADPSWRFWGLYVHVCKLETPHTAYRMAKANDGAPGIDGVTFDAIETAGVEGFLAQLRDELVTFRYRPQRGIGLSGTGSGKFRRRGRRRCEPSPPFPPSATAWSRER